MDNMDNMDNMYDAVIVGGGPAGLTAALYLARARYRVVVVEKEHFGGQITITSEVVNYPGVKKTSGAKLTETMRAQAQSFGAEFLLAEVESMKLEGDIKEIRTGKGVLKAFGVLLATGAHPRMVGFAGEEEFKGRGVAYCATCDGEFFTGREVFVIGGGFAAAEESVFLTKYASHVTILMVTEDFTCAQATAEEARNNDKITVLNNVEVLKAEGDSALRALEYRNLKTGEVTRYEAPAGDSFGLFVFAGYEPASSLVKEMVELDPYGYILTDGNQKTNLDGVYAAGDVCRKNLRQVVTAVGDGALAATELERHAAALQKKTGLTPRQPVTRLPAETNKEDPPKTDTGKEGESMSDLFTPEMLAQLQTVFDKMEQGLVLELTLDDRPVSGELEGYMESLAELTPRLRVVKRMAGEGDEAPVVRICREDGSWSGLSFGGVPGGHEFTSFILGLYNAAGPGQAIEQEQLERIRAIGKPTELTIMVSLSCTMCPELVVSAQRIAAANPLVSARVYDLNHFPELKDRYQVMSVPCMVIDQDRVTFGKKNVKQILELLEEGL